MGTRLPSPKGAQPPIFGQCPLWPNGWMNEDAIWYGGRPRPRRLCVQWRPSSPQKKAQAPAKFLAHVYYGQTVGWMNTPLCMEVDLGPGHIVLDRDPAPPRKGHSGPCLLWPRSPISVTAELLLRYASGQTRSSQYFAPPMGAKL